MSVVARKSRHRVEAIETKLAKLRAATSTDLITSDFVRLRDRQRCVDCHSTTDFLPITSAVNPSSELLSSKQETALPCGTDALERPLRDSMGARPIDAQNCEKVVAAT